ncbi:MAG: hypothetical protein KatS3mg084_0271 [Candidatus Dojkabacteria bacterium]|nr:MAG: hypothetical protein KatS3mg084_0271 [Candidatus Dojkabacteria bacterium]
MTKQDYRGRLSWFCRQYENGSSLYIPIKTDLNNITLGSSSLGYILVGVNYKMPTTFRQIKSEYVDDESLFTHLNHSSIQVKTGESLYLEFKQGKYQSLLASLSIEHLQKEVKRSIFIQVI